MAFGAQPDGRPVQAQQCRHLGDAQEQALGLSGKYCSLLTSTLQCPSSGAHDSLADLLDAGPAQPPLVAIWQKARPVALVDLDI